MKLNRRTVFIFATIIITVAIDQISKVLVRTHVEAGSSSQIIGDYFLLLNVENEGAFLGMGSDLNDTLKLILLLILPIIVLAFVLRHVIKDKRNENVKPPKRFKQGLIRFRYSSVDIISNSYTSTDRFLETELNNS